MRLAAKVGKKGEKVGEKTTDRQINAEKYRVTKWNKTADHDRADGCPAICGDWLKTQRWLTGGDRYSVPDMQ